jgi:hypothetical protein
MGEGSNACGWVMPRLKEVMGRSFSQRQEVQMRLGTEIMAAMATQAVGAAAHGEAEKIWLAQSEV